jgi:hypothetical protein
MPLNGVQHVAQILRVRTVGRVLEFQP